MGFLTSIQRARLGLLSGFSLALILMVSWGLRSHYLWGQPLDYDEGHWLMFGALTNAGYSAYSITFVGIPPLALWVIQAGEALFGPTLAVRYPMMLLSLVGVGGIFWTMQPWQNRLNLLTGVLTAIFLSLNPVYFYGSVSIMAEVPAVALAILSLTFAWQYYANRRLIWLALSGLIFAFSLALKVFIIFLPILIAILILLLALQRPDRTIGLFVRPLMLAGGVWLGGFLLPVLIFSLIYNPLNMYRDVFLFRLVIRDVWVPRTNLLDNIVMVGQMWGQFSPLAVGALFGIMMGQQRHRPEVLLWASWLVMATLLLIWHIPLRERYAVMLVPPLAALTGLGLTYGTIWVYRWLIPKWNRWLSLTIPTLLLTGLISWTLVDPLRSAARSPAPDTFPDLNLAAVRYVWQYSLPDDCIITDDQRFAFAADRLVPPALSETSWARIITGWLMVDDIAHQIIQRNCPMLVYSGPRFDQHLPDLRARLAQLYLLEIEFGEEVAVFTANKQITRSPGMPVQARLGESIKLTGVDLSPMPPWRPGQEVRLATYWTATEQPPDAYKIFVQLRNNTNEIIAGADHFPFPAPVDHYRVIPHLDNSSDVIADMSVYPTNGMWPTNAWPVEQVIREITPISLPPNLPAGQYHLYIGMYNPDTQTRLPVYTATDQNDSIKLTSIEIVN